MMQTVCREYWGPATLPVPLAAPSNRRVRVLGLKKVLGSCVQSVSSKLAHLAPGSKPFCT